MKRIAIVGISGSGKSTLANNLGKKLNIPVHHLDKYFWDKNWKRRYSRPEFHALVKDFYKEDKWIIDGNYRKASIDLRLEMADTIILLDFPKWRAVWRAFIRVFNRQQPFDKTEGVKNKIDLPFLKWIIRYKTKELRERVSLFKSEKNIVILRNNKEIDVFFNSL